MKTQRCESLPSRRPFLPWVCLLVALLCAGVPAQEVAPAQEGAGSVAPATDTIQADETGAIQPDETGTIEPDETGQESATEVSPSTPSVESASSDESEDEGAAETEEVAETEEAETTPTAAATVPQPAPAKAPLSLANAQEANTRLTPQAVLQNSPVFQRLLGENPAFIYDAGTAIDPMLIPWTRARVMFDELRTIADEAIKTKNWVLAETALNRILSDLTTNRQYVAEAETLMAQLETLRAQDMAAGPHAGKQPEAKLPKWVRDNTRGVLYDVSNPMVLVGQYMLNVGDRVPQQFPDVIVAKIERTTVTYRVFDKTFPVQVNVQEGE